MDEEINIKAKELVEKYFVELKEHKGVYDYETAKQCALIAVDELIKLYELDHPHRGFKVSYWDEVKQAIEQL